MSKYFYKESDDYPQPPPNLCGCGYMLTKDDIILSGGQLCEDADCNYVLDTYILTVTCPICGEEQSESSFTEPDEDDDLLELFIERYLR